MLILLALLACASPPAPSPAPGAAVPTTGPVHDVFPPPPGATRVPSDAFGAWLADLLVLPPDRPVRTWDGRVVSNEDRVIDLPLVKGDLQQCADSALRLRGEWLRAGDRPVSFHATSGDAMPWSRYAAGEEPYEQGGRIRWRPGGDRTWDGYLRKLFLWAGSASLERLDTVAADAPSPGRLLVQGGFPGHVVVLLDVATDARGTLVLVGEGYMPAQDFHVQVGPEAGWWRWEGGLDMPHWQFGPEHLRAFAD